MFWFSRAPIAKDCTDCGLADRGLEPAKSRVRAPRTPRAMRSSVDWGSARKVTQSAPRKGFRDRC
eukprot:7120069-Alexandrium_andersonii.AAC.1